MINNKDELGEFLGNLSNKIEELEKIIQKIGVKTDFTSQESGQALKEIAELRNQIQNNSVADLNHYNELKEQIKLQAFDMSIGSLTETNTEGIINLQVVLRELIKEVEIFREDEGYEINLLSPLLEKLDGKDSGGEKVEAESLRVNPEIPPSVLGKDDNSKPPEPKSCYNCGWLDHEFCRNTIAIVHADGGESCWKPKEYEPSEKGGEE